MFVFWYLICLGIPKTVECLWGSDKASISFPVEAQQALSALGDWLNIAKKKYREVIHLLFISPKFQGQLVSSFHCLKPLLNPLLPRHTGWEGRFALWKLEHWHLQPVVAPVPKVWFLPGHRTCQKSGNCQRLRLHRHTAARQTCLELYAGLSRCGLVGQMFPATLGKAEGPSRMLKVWQAFCLQNVLVVSKFCYVLQQISACGILWGLFFFNLIESFLITSPYLPRCMHICLLLVCLPNWFFNLR